MSIRDGQDLLVYEFGLTGKGLRDAQDMLIFEVTTPTGHIRCAQDLLVFELPATGNSTTGAHSFGTLIGF